MDYGCVELVEKDCSTRSSRRASHVKRVETFDVTSQAEFGLYQARYNELTLIWSPVAGNWSTCCTSTTRWMKIITRNVFLPLPSCWADFLFTGGTPFGAAAEPSILASLRLGSTVENDRWSLSDSPGLYTISINFIIMAYSRRAWVGWDGLGKMTTDSGRNGAITLSRMTFSGYEEHATIFSWTLTTACCFVVALGLGFCVWLVIGYAHVLTLLPLSLCRTRLRRDSQHFGRKAKRACRRNKKLDKDYSPQKSMRVHLGFVPIHTSTHTPSYYR